ncbi:MAG TPA: hypothetical protein VHU18_13450 [Rhizomicrobium sp.]|jgi:hypothetical protein|nr:hypothetical protein [Rhizomicrobium sp.]
MNFAHAKPPHGSCAAQAVLQLPRLKWYCVAAPDQPVPPEIEAMARSVPAETDLQSVSAFGFVVLHRCGSDFYFLIVCSWQGNNEIWETVYAKDKVDSGFRDWPRPGAHVPTFCIREMGAVAHESRRGGTF